MQNTPFEADLTDRDHSSLYPTADCCYDWPWPPEKNFEQALSSWSRQHEIMARHMNHAHFRRHIMILDYDALFFQPNDTAAETLQDFLGLPHDPAFRTLLDELVAGNRGHVNKAETRLPPEALEQLRKLNRSAFEDLKAVTA
ncbi:hypothetical protein [Ruegeria sp. PrR005]|uniref:Sulfotransferase n=1 Tax=Ruegeria sp. PrR005 TaxID=2706882 RepID=A0A6B2NP42_9RHOB|nr:hypothetical protein [Ruegeria sp. PrR005]NDW44279.1 hypothetical protein [Ruegeria sp. PrR005]